MDKIIASGPVIIQNNKLLVTKNKKSEFCKIPGGTLEKGESLEECATREIEEETGLNCKLIKKLPTMKLKHDPDTEKEIDVYLYHYLGKLIQKVKNYKTYDYKGHEVRWLPIDKIKQKKYNVAPNIYFLIDKREII